MSLPALLEQRLRLPLIAAPMFLVSNPVLVGACCNAGIVGSFPALNQRESAGFRAWLDEIQASLSADAAPYAVNLIVHHSNPRLQADLAICVERRVPIVITSLGAVKEVVDAVHGYGGLVFHDVTTRRHAEKAAEAGVDGLIAVATGAGGHAGTLSPFASSSTRPCCCPAASTTATSCSPRNCSAPTWATWARALSPARRATPPTITSA
jgi:nitronate monooxygenase